MAGGTRGTNVNILDFLTNGQASQLDSNGDGAQRLVANLMMQRSEWLRSLLDSSRNVDADCGYPTGYIDAKIYWELYQREPIATRTVEVYPKESWQVQPQIYELEDASAKTPFEEAWDALGKQLRGEQSFYQEEEASVVFDFLCDADIKCGIGHYAAILLGFDDGAPLDQPIDLIDAGKPAKASAPSSGASRRLLFMQVYPETAVQINSLEADMQSPRYGLPTEYDISMMDPLEFSSLGVGTSLPSRRASVHWTRVVHISEYGVLHTPRQRPVLNRLLDLRKLYGGSAEMYWRGAFPGYAIKTQPQLGADVDINREDVKQQLTDYSNALQRFLVLMGMDITALAPQVSDPSSQIDKQVEAICIQLGIPKRIFMGSERGELASSQDDAAWNDRLKQRQLGVITPRIIIPFVDRLIATRVLPRPAKGYRVSWPDLTSKSDEEKAGIATQRTQAIAAYASGQLETTLAPMDFWTRIMGFTEDESQSIIDNAEEIKQQKEKEQAAKDAEAAKVQAEAQAKADAAAKTAADATGTEQTPTAPESPTSPGKAPGGKDSPSPTSGPPNGSKGQPGGSNAGGAGSTPVAHAFDPYQPLDNLDTNANAALSGGQWITIRGRHVYVKDGKIVVGPSDLVGETPASAQIKTSDQHKEGTGKSASEPRGKPESATSTKPEASKTTAEPAPAPDKGHSEGRSFDSVKEADKWGAKEFGSWGSGLSKSENWAVDAYSGGGYENINMYLRGKTDSDFSAAPGKTRQVMEGLDSALAKGSAPEPLTTYRGVRSDPGDPHSLVKQLVEAAKSGGTFSDKAYVSSSMVGKVAEKQFSGGSRKDVERAIIKIGVPKGSHGAYTDVLDITGEAEWLMPRGSTFKVTGATKRDDGVWEISAHVHEVDKHG
jgi:hypothetical protein